MALSLIGPVLAILLLSVAADGQCIHPNITALTMTSDLPIGSDLVVGYLAPITLNGHAIYTLYSHQRGKTPLSAGCSHYLPLTPPFHLLGTSQIANGWSIFSYRVPAMPELVGTVLHVAGMVVDQNPGKTGASNSVLVTIRLEDFPLGDYPDPPEFPSLGDLNMIIEALDCIVKDSVKTPGVEKIEAALARARAAQTAREGMTPDIAASNSLIRGAVTDVGAALAAGALNPVTADRLVVALLTQMIQ